MPWPATISVQTNTVRSIAVLLLALLAYLVGNERVSLWDRDEPRYAQTSRQMLQSGDWVVPHLYDNIRRAKPPLIYWCQAGSMALLGDTAAAARLPSALAMLLTLMLILLALPGARGFWTMFILASSLLIFWSAKSALTDAVLLLFITVSQLCVYRLWRGDRSWVVVIILSVAIGLGGLTKGPIVLGVPLATLITLAILSRGDRRGKHSIGWLKLPGLKLLTGTLIVAAVVGPWCYLVEQRCPGFITGAFQHEVIDRAANPQEGHAGPPGYYLLTIWPMFFPWSLLLPATLLLAWRNRRLPHIRFALAAVIGPWIMLELIRTKLPHYLLPVYPFLAFLTADLLIRTVRRRTTLLINPGFVRIVAGWAIVVGLIGLSPWIALRWFPFDRAAFFGLLIFSLLTAEYARSVYVATRGGKPLLAADLMGFGMFILVIVLHAGFLPAADFLQISRRLATVMQSSGATTPGDEIMIDYKEPSLAFYQGGTIREESRDNYLATVDPIYWPDWIVITSDVLKKTPPDRLAHLIEISSAKGVDYAGKGVVEVKLLKRGP